MRHDGPRAHVDLGKLRHALTNTQAWKVTRGAVIIHTKPRATWLCTIEKQSKRVLHRARSPMQCNAPRRQKKNRATHGELLRTAENNFAEVRFCVQCCVFHKQKSCSQRVKDILLQYLDIKVQRTYSITVIHNKLVHVKMHKPDTKYQSIIVLMEPNR